jgi:integrase
MAQKLAQVEKLPRGVFRRGPMYWIRYVDANGKLRREPGGTTLKQAEAKLKVRRGEKATGVVPVLRMDQLKQLKERRAATFETWIDAAEDHQKKHNSKAHAYDFSRKCIYLREGLGAMPIGEVNHRTVSGWMKEASEGGVTGDEEWGEATWNRYHSCLSSIFSLAIDRAIADQQDPPINPMQWIPRRKENHKERYWSFEEDAAIIAAAQRLYPDAGYEDIFILAEEVGYRKSEQLRAIAGDYNQETHKITVHQRKSKSAGLIRYVPLSDRGLAAYERLAKGKVNGEPLLTRKLKGKSQPMQDVRYWFDDVLATAKITDEAASWHVCRHTFCSRAVAAGVPISDVKEYAGHSDLRTTNRYTHGVEGVSDVRNRQAMNQKTPRQQSEVAALQEQIAALIALVQKLQK